MKQVFRSCSTVGVWCDGKMRKKEQIPASYSHHMSITWVIVFWWCEDYLVLSLCLICVVSVFLSDFFLTLYPRWEEGFACLSHLSSSFLLAHHLSAVGLPTFSTVRWENFLRAPLCPWRTFSQCSLKLFLTPLWNPPKHSQQLFENQRTFSFNFNYDVIFMTGLPLFLLIMCYI